MCYVNLLESIEQYIAYTHVVYICVTPYVFLLHDAVSHLDCTMGKNTASIMCSMQQGSIRCSKPHGHQGPPGICMRGKPLSEIIAEELAAEGLGEGWAFLPGSSPAPILAPKSASLGFMRPDRMFR